MLKPIFLNPQFMRVSFQSVEDAAMSSYQNLRAIMIDAVREYCAEHYFRPYIWVEVDSACRVPSEYVKDGMIILDIDDEAVRGFQMNDEYLRSALRRRDGFDGNRRAFEPRRSCCSRRAGC